VQGTVRPIEEGGLINQTFLVGKPPAAVLQWLNPIFSPAVNADIDAVTRHLLSRGLTTPTVLPTRTGGLWHDDPKTGCWRMLSWVPGITVHRVDSPARAHAAGATLGGFHAALDGWSAPRHAPVRRIHDTPARMAELEAALREHRGHALYDAVAPVADTVLRAWQRWPGRLDLPERTCHGDPKISNVRFDESGEGVCMIDLDTVGPQTLDCELGDAWRSWCNPAGEDRTEGIAVDLALFAASARGFFEAAPPLDEEERTALVPGLERICLELAARFAKDALLNSYFREDRGRFPQPGAHNLHRARVQLALGQDAARQRGPCTEALASAAEAARTC
jgi:Ser/Thr protein kinase RdoA (MazF antagonist)